MIHDGDLPYFDMLLGALEARRPGLSATFGHHVHWGYWGPEDRPKGTLEDFAVASERMSRRVQEAGGTRDGARILDAGCGLGGTLASLDARLSDVELVGLNIDARQLGLARERVRPRAGNRIAFVEGDACRMPFPDASFDVVLALECVFHFPSRERFLREARRVLRPGGRLAITDFVPPGFLVPPLVAFESVMGGYIQSAIGPIDVHTTRAGYLALAREAGFGVLRAEDITDNTLPTYPVLRRLIDETGVPRAVAHFWITALQAASVTRALSYMLFTFDAPGN